MIGILPSLFYFGRSCLLGKEWIRSGSNYSSSYHPQSNGQINVVNKSLEHYLRAFAADKPSLWVEWLPLVEYWFNTNYHTSTKLSPFEALYGYSPPKLLEFVPGTTRVAAIEELLQHRQQVMSILQENLVVAQRRMK